VSAKPIVVFDTQVLLRATINRKSLPAKVFFDERNAYYLAASEQTIAEARDVLGRSELRKIFKTLTDQTVEETLKLLTSGQQVALKEVKPVSRDPKDDIFLATAVESQANYLVTEDNDLLVLDPYQGIRVINVLTFLRVLHELQAKGTHPRAE